MALTVPLPRSPIDGGLVRWYERELGWAAVDGPPVQLVTGCASTSWSCPPRPAGRCCADMAGPPDRWPSWGAECGC